MISPEQLHAYLEKLDKGVVAVDLLKIGQTYALNSAHQAYNVKTGANIKTAGRFRVALDIEQCLDRFYGGYYSDWACGGQWNRCLQFVQLLASAFNTAHIEVVAFFDGTLKENKRLQHEHNDYRQKALSVLKHIRMIGTPPPKVWWLPPSGIRTCIRNALRTVNIQVVQTVHDHTMELIDYFHEHRLHAIIGLHADFLIAQVSRYFSSHDLRLSYKGALETKEIFPAKLLATLQLNRDQLAVLAALLGGYILLDETALRQIYKKINVELNTDFESRIKMLADVIKANLPSTQISLDDFIRKLDLEEFGPQLKESIEYYQRRGAFSGKRYLGNKKKAILAEKSPSEPKSIPMASETAETDEATKKLLSDASEDHDEAKCQQSQEKNEKPSSSKKSVKFVYTLPAEVIRTAAERHKRGIMDPRIYILLIKKEILLPQLLEDEQFRDFPSIHEFYRPARQMIYAILFNLYHQKYMHQKGGHNKNSDGKDLCPSIIINEWIWTPKNEFKTPEKVTAVQINWAVPTVQRLWFGTAHEDKQRRMKAFLTIMRSDTPLMLNKNYVPQHLLVLACVLRYIVAEHPIMTGIELDAFIATAFSSHLINVDFTQEMVLPSVHSRGVYLGTLFMQGVETAQMANDACGVPLPWSMTNPWLFFDGKLFHLKLKMSNMVSNLRELCDDLVDVMLKVERFKKAVLEDIEHLLPMTQVDPLFRQGIFGQGPSAGPLNPHLYKNLPLQLQSELLLGGNNFYNQKGGQGLCETPSTTLNKKPQLKVGGVVVGSWAQGAPNRQYISSNRARFPINKQRVQRGGRVVIQTPTHPNSYRIMPNNVGGGYQYNPAAIAAGGHVAKTIAGQKLRMNKSQKQNNKIINSKGGSAINKNNLKGKTKAASSSSSSSSTLTVTEEKKILKKPNDAEIASLTDKAEKMSLKSSDATTVGVPCMENGNVTEDLESTVAKVCDKVLKEEDDELTTKGINGNENVEDLDNNGKSSIKTGKSTHPIPSEEQKSLSTDAQ